MLAASLKHALILKYSESRIKFLFWLCFSVVGVSIVRTFMAGFRNNFSSHSGCRKAVTSFLKKLLFHN